MLLQISEPNQSPKPHEHRYGIGIDLGTTHSLVATVQSGSPKVMAIDGKTLVPSVVYYGGQAPLVGECAKTFAISEPEQTIVSVKRLMGRSINDIKFSHAYELTGDNDTMPSIITKAGAVSPVQVSAMILDKLYRHAQEVLGGSVAGAVITVPAYFDEAQRQATKAAAIACQINVLRLLNEPTAAAMAYGLHRRQQGKVLVYDLGGGTFDVSLLSLNEGIFEVLAIGGNSALGGDDIDRLLANFLLNNALSKKSKPDTTLTKASDTPTKLQKAQLIQHARTIKEQLSNQSSVAVVVPELGIDTVIDNAQLAQIITPVTKRTLTACQRVLDDAGVGIADIDEVVLVGGSTRMPVIKDSVAQFFGKSPLCELNPDEVVAQGAAILADQLINSTADNTVLLDVTPLSLGLETMGGLVEVIIPRNTPIPTERRNQFTTHSDGQTGMVIHVVQGERDKASDCRSLARFELYGIPPMKAGLARVEVSFAIDVNGQLTVSAQELTTGVASSIDVIPANGLSEAQQLALLQAGFDNAQSDKQARMFIETKVEAERELIALQSALQEFGQLLSDDEKQHIAQAMSDVKTAISDTAIDNTATGDKKAKLDTAINQLKTLSDVFAGRIMNQSVKSALAGTRPQDW